jgi:hypothetical protein
MLVIGVEKWRESESAHFAEDNSKIEPNSKLLRNCRYVNPARS